MLLNCMRESTDRLSQLSLPIDMVLSTMPYAALSGSRDWSLMKS